MEIKRNVALSGYSTMGLGGKANYLVEVDSKETLTEAINLSSSERLKVIMIGGGSNIIWKDEGFKGLVIVNRIRGFNVEHEDDKGADVLIGAGEDWDLVVDRCVSLGLSGVECLSLVPGSAGATPVQNVGAYGQEIADTLISVEAYDIKQQSFVTLLNKDCNFSYRNSRFKKEPGRFLIISIRLHLNKASVKPPLYKALEDYLSSHNLTDTSPATLRKAVIDIRSHKLPDPKVVKNCGSFFHNPVIAEDKFNDLVKKHGDMPHWPNANGIKISAAWLVDQAGFKDFNDPTTGMATWPGQPLVVINQTAAKTADLLKFKAKIVETIKRKFDIELVQEPELLPN